MDLLVDAFQHLVLVTLVFKENIAWADPETNIVYVFLSNRTYPEYTGNTLLKGKIREDIQQVIQNAIVTL